MKKFFFLFLIINSLTASISSLYKTIPSNSLEKLFAFYELYSNTQEGKIALLQIEKLLGISMKEDSLFHSFLENIGLDIFIHTKIEKRALNNEEKLFLEKISSTLSHKKLKGHSIFSVDEILTLPATEIDIARLLLLEDSSLDKESILFYEALLDLMAIEILLKLPQNPTSYQKIEGINQFLFFEKNFRFPPHSLVENHVDSYSMLPEVLGEGKGICLGISMLFLSIAQRLGLELEPVTFPGHIFLRYVDKTTKKERNIETTLRGVEIDNEDYITIEHPHLKVRDLKELPGLVLMNQASLENKKENYEKALLLYYKAKKYMKDDPILDLLLGFHLLFTKKSEGLSFLKESNKKESSSLIEDFIEKKIDIEGIKEIFRSYDAKRSSILEKQKRLKEILKKFPKFREGILSLAKTSLDLLREKEAISFLNDYLKLESDSLEVNYYLSLLYLKRMNYCKAWSYFRKVEDLVDTSIHLKSIHFLKKELEQTSLSR